VLLPEDHEELALTLNGKKTNLRRNDFLHFAEQCGMTRPAAEKILQSVTAAEADYLRLCDESYLPEELTTALKELITARCARLRA